MWLTLKDARFPIRRAELSASIPDPYWSAKYNAAGDPRLTWYFEVHGERVEDQELWEPMAYHQNLRFPIRRWPEVTGQVVEWATPVDDEANEPNGAFYVLEHEAISRAKLCFFEREAARFRFSWEGICDVFWDEEYGRDVPFKAEGWASFTGVRVCGSESDTNESMRARLARYLDVRDFRQGPLSPGPGTYVDGVGMAGALFTPHVDC